MLIASPAKAEVVEEKALTFAGDTSVIFADAEDTLDLDTKTPEIIVSQIQQELETSPQPLLEESVSLPPATVDNTEEIEITDLRETTAADSAAADDFNVFPVGLDVRHTTSIVALVKGQEEGGHPIAFEQWRIPFDDVVQLLNIQVTTLDDGDWELRSQAAIIRINPTELTTDPDLGLVLSIAEIETRLGIPATFDTNSYAIQFKPPKPPRQQQQQTESAVVTAGLPTITSDIFSLSGIGQQTTLSGRIAEEDRAGSSSWRGRLNAVGTAFGGSWYAEIEQPQVDDRSSWHLDELQYLHYGEHQDYALGSQPTFWHSQGRDYWGATFIQRWGFEPPAQRGKGGFNPRQQLQATNLERTINGEAAPGTLVQLTRNNQLIDEVLVDSSGLYRFTNVSSTGQGRYRILLFPNGQLTATPIEADATFSSLPGQLPVGASVLVVSAGFGRDVNNQFIGDFNSIAGGLSYRAGVSESLTLGAGLIHDKSLKLLTEVFYSPDYTPLQASISALVAPTNSEVEINADVRWRPTDDINLSFNSDRFSQRFRADWTALPNMALTLSGNTRDNALALGTRLNLNRGDFNLFGQATVDTNSNIRWNAQARYGALGLRHRGDEVTTQSQLSYNLSGGLANSTGHSLNLGYETRNVNDPARLATASWRYTSHQLSPDGRSKWDIELGYGVGTAGSGPIAQVTTGILPGVDLRARYTGVSTLSSQDTFQLEISPRFNLQRGIGLGSHRQDWLRTQGGLMIQPFLDDNNNGQRDPGESAYLEDLDLLVTVNHQSLDYYQPQIQNSHATITLTPGVYRIDLDAAGFPLDRQATDQAIAAEVTPGEYTQVLIPLGRSFSVSGVVLDADGNAMGGQQVKIVNTDSNRSQLSVTNGAGVFYLEGISPGSYRFELGDQIVESTPLDLGDTSQSFQEINFKVLLHGIETQIPSLDMGLP